MSDHFKGAGYEPTYHYFPINISADLMPTMTEKPGEQMPKTDPLDRPITVRDLKEAFDAARRGRTFENSFYRTVGALVAKAEQPPHTDFVKVRFAGKVADHIIRIVNQPTRRVQVGDLVTMAPNGWVLQPQVVRVREIDVPAPAMLKASAVGVAISPEDAERIEAVVGRVR